MKPISFEQFQKTRKKIDKCGVSGYVYDSIPNISILDLEMAFTVFDLEIKVYESSSLGDAEKVVYENEKEKGTLPMEKEDPVDFPRGIDNWMKTYYQIVLFLSTDIDKRKMISSYKQFSTKQKHAVDLTTMFENKNKDIDFDESCGGALYCFLSERPLTEKTFIAEIRTRNNTHYIKVSGKLKEDVKLEIENRIKNGSLEELIFMKEMIDEFDLVNISESST